MFVEERRRSSIAVEARHVRLVVVERAPALFSLPCGDRSCKGGGTTSRAWCWRAFAGAPTSHRGGWLLRGGGEEPCGVWSASRAAPPIGSPGAGAERLAREAGGMPRSSPTQPRVARNVLLGRWGDEPCEAHRPLPSEGGAPVPAQTDLCSSPRDSDRPGERDSMPRQAPRLRLMMTTRGHGPRASSSRRAGAPSRGR